MNRTHVQPLAAKYPEAAINGVLIGRIEANEVEIIGVLSFALAVLKVY